MFGEDLIVVALLGLTHGFDPDHIATAKMLKSFRKITIFSLSHSLGFVVLAIPLALIFIFTNVSTNILELSSDIVGIIIGVILLVSVITEKEFEIEPKSMGLLQGALIVTPSKVLTAILAITSGSIIDAITIVVVFVITSTLSIMTLSLFRFIPETYSKIVNALISLITIIFFSLMITQIL